MAHHEETSDRVLNLLAYEPRELKDGMIKVEEPAAFSSIVRKCNTSSTFGYLDALPLELLHSVLAYLDCHTLSSVSETCLRGLAVVESLPEYRSLMKHAPKTLAALGATRLIHHHSVATLYNALLGSKCASCDHFAPFLFLPTCERCCYLCLNRNQSLWVFPLWKAKDCLKLSSAELERLPIMHSLPGKYLDANTRYQRFRLVSVRAARDLASTIRIEQQTAGTYDATKDMTYTIKQWEAMTWLQNGPLEPLTPEFAEHLSERLTSWPRDDFCGMASLPFPSLSPNGKAEHGIWCRGCQTSKFGQSLGLRYIMKHTARSKKEFMEHISSCSYALELIPDLQEQLAQAAGP